MDEFERFKFALWVSFDLEKSEQQMFEDFADMKVREIEQFRKSDFDYWDFVILRPKRLRAVINKRFAENQAGSNFLK